MLRPLGLRQLGLGPRELEVDRRVQRFLARAGHPRVVRTATANYLRKDAPVEGSLPTGTVTFLFTDVEGSTRLLHELGAEGYAEALAEHRRVLREAFERHGGVEVDTQGDAFFVAFPTAPEALGAAARGDQRGLAPGRSASGWASTRGRRS